MYGLIQAQMRSPFALSRASIASGSGKVAGSHVKSDQWKPRIQKQSKWNTDSGRSRSAIPSMKLLTVASSYSVVKLVDSHSP